MGGEEGSHERGLSVDLNGSILIYTTSFIITLTLGVGWNGNDLNQYRIPMRFHSSSHNTKKTLLLTHYCTEVKLVKMAYIIHSSLYFDPSSEELRMEYMLLPLSPFLSSQQSFELS